jgi:uncharacterized protein DUF6527
MTNPATVVSLKGVAERQPEAARLLINAGDIAFVERGVLRSLVIKCPDGCGEIITVNLDPRSGPAWHLYPRQDGKITVYPSVWRDSGCGAHFIIWRNRILGFGGDADISWQDHALRSRVLNHLPSFDAAPVHFEHLAEQLGDTPWDVAWECQRLTRDGLAVSSDKNQKFRLAPKKRT